MVSGESQLADGPSRSYTVRGPLCESTYGYVQGMPFMTPSL